MRDEKTMDQIVKLEHSIPIPKEGGGTVNVSELRFGRLKAKHLRSLPENFMERGGNLEPQDVIPLIASLADIPVDSADEIDIDDLLKVAAKLESFFGASLKTGKK